MLSPTCQQLVRELGRRRAEFILATASAGGSSTLLVDTGLRQYFPQIEAEFNAWVYGVATGSGQVSLNNRGVERRAESFDAAAGQITLYSPGFPDVVTSGQYEIHTRMPRERKLEALNAGIGQLGLSWYRNVVDETITTAANTWTYTLPAGVLWEHIDNVHIQISTVATLVGYPYRDAGIYNWVIRPATDANGDTVWTLQFGGLPPSGRRLRIFGQAAYLDLAAETDILALPERWARPATEWLYLHAGYLLATWEGEKWPAGEGEYARMQARKYLEEQRLYLAEHLPTRPNARVIVPGMGDGEERPLSPRERQGLLAAYSYLT